MTIRYNGDPVLRPGGRYREWARVNYDGEESQAAEWKGNGGVAASQQEPRRFDRNDGNRRHGSLEPGPFKTIYSGNDLPADVGGNTPQ
ncbi:unnamed protein product [Lota lota]